MVDPEIPNGVPPSAPPSAPKRPERRPSLTLKGPELGPEFRALLNKAATRRGLTQAAFVVEAVTREAHAVLKSAPSSAPLEAPSSVPVVIPPPVERLESKVDTLAALVEKLIAEAEARPASRRGWWWGALRGPPRSPAR